MTFDMAYPVLLSVNVRGLYGLLLRLVYEEGEGDALCDEEEDIYQRRMR